MPTASWRPSSAAGARASPALAVSDALLPGRKPLHRSLVALRADGPGARAPAAPRARPADLEAEPGETCPAPAAPAAPGWLFALGAEAPSGALDEGCEPGKLRAGRRAGLRAALLAGLRAG